jgi:serine/threonine kinase 16
MHTYRSPQSAALPSSNKQNGVASSSSSNAKIPARRNTAERNDDEDDDDEDERFPQPEGDADDGYSYDAASVPLVTRNEVAAGEVVFYGDEETAATSSSESGEIVPYAHRDLKPG